jgi:hypothetical protein
MSINDGGPAFPVPAQPDPNGGMLTWNSEGMTLRDHFAGQALQGYLASFPGHCEPAEVASTIAEDCYKLADAMLAARSKI